MSSSAAPCIIPRGCRGGAAELPTKVRESRLVDQRALYPEQDLAFYQRYGWGEEGPNDKQAAEFLGECAASPSFYIFSGAVRTIDGNDRKNPVKPFPDYPYLKEMLDHIHPFDIPDDDCDQCAIPKSRQLSMTWLACAYLTWEARFHEHSLNMVQSKKAEDAWMLVYKRDWNISRCGFIERAMPMFMRAKGLMGTRGELTYPNGSQIWGIPQGGHQIRGYMVRVLVSDETCFQDEFEDAHAAALSTVRRMILISTADYGTYFGKLIEQDDVEEEAA